MDSGPPPTSVLPLMEGGGSGMSIKEHAQICGQETSAQINGSQWISDPPWCSAFNRGGVSGMDIRFVGPLVICGVNLLVLKSHPPTCYLTACHSWTSSSTESSCSTCSRGRVTSHNCCSSLLSVLFPFHS
jgi:hypothetical protein